MTEIKTKEKTSYSQVLNVDNSILLDINFDEIDPPLDNPNKRKLKEIISNEHDNGTIFKTPQSVRKRKRRISHADETRRSKESSLVSKTSISSEISSQDILKCIAIDNLELTQTNESLNELEHDDEYSNVITNPTTNSQYIENRLQRNPEAGSSPNELNCNQSKGINDENEHATKNKTPKQVSKYKKLLPVSSFAFREMGSFFGLTKHQKAFILQTKNIEKLYEWQEECLGLRAIHDRSNLIYALPTSGGKTLVAEIAMIREVLLRKRNVIFVLPYVSIVQEKINDLMPFAVEFDFLLEEYCAGKGSIPPIKRRKKNTIFISTIEKSQILFDSLYENNRLNEVGMIVVDELHMLGDEKRGYHLEVLLSKAVFHKQPHIQIIAMSATISNLKEIARFLNADVYTREFRPVELKEYVKIGSDIFSVDGKTRYISDAFKVSRNDFGKEYTRQMLKRDPDHLAALSLEIIPKSSCLIFCATKQNCENVAKLLTELLPQELIEWKKEEKSTLMEHIKADANGRICPILAKTIPFGIAYHHSGMTNDERKHLEEAYRCNIICIICCTSTLAAGVNLPARRVIIRSPYVGQHFLTLSRYKQMIGRAGRAGKCSSGESILVCDPKDYQKLTTLLCSKMDETISGFVQDVSGMFIETVILNLIGTKVATSIDDLIDFFKCSLLS
ncbi:CLUMA_CG012478, isoform A, partial [Clunio marinus]